MKKITVALLILLPVLANAQILDTLATKKSLDSLILISASQRFKGQYEAMRVSAEQMIALAERLHGRQSAAVAIAWNTLAQAAMNLNDFDLAIRSTEESLAIRKALHGRKNQFVAWNYSNLGILYSRTGRLAEAEVCLLEFKAITADNLGPRHPDVGYALLHLANFYHGVGRYDAAEACILEVKDIWQEAFGEESANYATILSNLGVFVQTLGRFEEAEQYLVKAKSIRDNLLKPDHPDYPIGLNNLGNLYSGTGRYREAIPLLEQALQIWDNKGERDRAAYAATLANLSGAYVGIGDKTKAEALLIESLGRTQKAPDKSPGDYAKRLHNLAYLYKNSDRLREADSLFNLAEVMFFENIGRISLEYINTLINHATVFEAMENQDACLRLLVETNTLEYEMLNQVTQFLSEEELSLYITRLSDRRCQPFCVAFRQNVTTGLLADLCFNITIISKGYVQETVASIRRHALSDTASVRQFEALAALRRKLVKEYAYAPEKRDTIFVAFAEARANAIEKEMTRTAGVLFDKIQIIHTQEIRERLTSAEAAIEFISFTYFDLQGNSSDSTLYAALILLPSDTAPHFIPLFEERQLQALLHRPELGEELTVKGLYASNSELLSLLWTPLEPLLRDVKTIYYSPAGLLHRINPAALRDADKQPLSAGRAWVRVGSTRELVTGRLADRSYALDPNATATAAVWGGIRYDMDSTAFAAANPLDPNAGPLPEFERKDGKFRYMVEDGSPALPSRSGQRGGDIDGWEPLPGSEQETDQVDSLLQRAGFRTEVLTGYRATEERFKALGQTASSPRILHVATHGFAYPDPKKEPQRGFAGEEPVYKLQDDPMLRSGLLLAGANHYWTAKRPLQDREDGVLVAYEVRDLNLRNTELAVLSACQTGLGDVVGSEGVYGLQRAFRIAGAKFLIVSLWQVPDEQTRELMRLFYENWVDKRASLRDAFNHAQATLREQEPNPYMWAGFVLIE